MVAPKRKPLAPALTAYYKELEQAEKKTLSRTKSLIVAHHPAVKALIHLYYQYGADGERLNHALLRKKAPLELAMMNQTEAERLRAVFKGQPMEQPLSIMRFDKLNILDNLNVAVAFEELKQARNLTLLYSSQLDAELEKWLAFLMIYYEYDFEERMEALKRSAKANAKKAIVASMYKQAMIRSQGITTRITQSLIRGQDEVQTAEQVLDYIDRQTMNTSGRTLYTEDTAATEQAAIEALRPYIDAFFTRCVHDGKTCPICLDIERTQGEHPVAIELYEPSVTAPPFHPYCRCMVEILWRHDFDDDSGD